MEILVINIGSVDYSKYSLPFIQALCDYNSVKLTVLTEDIPHNVYKLHPSWLKVFCHDVCDDEFVVAWDLDLVPTCLYKFDNLFDESKLNMVKDGAHTKGGFTFNGKFRYNCGLIGVPRSYSKTLKWIYDTKGINPTYPSWEQYYINDYLYDENVDVNELNEDLNYMYDGNPIPDSCLNIHYTWLIKSASHRSELIYEHYNRFKKSLAISD